MEAHQYIREYVRDQCAWRRAAQQPSTDQRLTTPGNLNALWDVCRFGSAENAETAKFARALRERDPNIPNVSHKSWRVTREAPRYTSSAAPPSDILEVALQRNLRRAGLTIAFDKAAAHQRNSQARPKSSRAQATAQQFGNPRETHFVHCAVADLLVDETCVRKKIIASQQREATRLWRLVSLSRMNTVLDEEYNGRRLIFRAAVLEQKRILDAEEEAFCSRTGLSRDQFSAVSAIVGAEKKSRQALHRAEERDSATLQQLLQLLQLESLEREIASCARREAQLRGELSSQRVS